MDGIEVELSEDEGVSEVRVKEGRPLDVVIVGAEPVAVESRVDDVIETVDAIDVVSLENLRICHFAVAPLSAGTSLLSNLNFGLATT